MAGVHALAFSLLNVLGYQFQYSCVPESRDQEAGYQSLTAYLEKILGTQNSICVLFLMIPSDERSQSVAKSAVLVLP